MNFGKAIRTIRAAKNLDQKELARRADLNPSYISLIESNLRKPSANVLEALARSLGVPLYLLMLIASEKEDLHGVSATDTAELGSQLLGIVLEFDKPRRARAK